MVSPTPHGVQLALKVVTRSSRNRVAGVAGEQIKVCVTSAPERGKANDGVVETVADWLGVAPGRVRIAAGATSSRKVVDVLGVTADQVRVKLAAMSGGGL